jgi:hypothetical protein
MTAAWRAWSRFWFESRAYAPMRVFRTALGGLLFVFYSIRTADLEFFFGEKGILPLAVMREVMPLAYQPSIHHFFPGDMALWGAHALFLASLLALALGFRPRLAAGIAFVLHVSFLHRNLGTAFGIDLISTFFLLYLSFAAYRPGSGGMLGSMAYRLCQIQVCVIYFYSGLHKLKGLHWWRGEAIWDVLANAQLARWDFSWVSAYPLAIVAATYVTLLWEAYFPVLVWLPRLRYPMLALGVALHVGIAVAVNIPFFGLLMIVSYAVFLRPRHAIRLETARYRIGRAFFRRAKAKVLKPRTDEICV